MPVKITCHICQKEFEVCPYRASSAKYCSYTCHQIGEGRKAGAKRAKQLKSVSQKKSYVKKQGGHEHRKIVEDFIGRKLHRKEIIHHKDGDKFNNHISNLQLLSQSEHIKFHREELNEARRKRKEVAP